MRKLLQCAAAALLLITVCAPAHAQLPVPTNVRPELQSVGLAIVWDFARPNVPGDTYELGWRNPRGGQQTSGRPGADWWAPFTGLGGNTLFPGALDVYRGETYDFAARLRNTPQVSAWSTPLRYTFGAPISRVATPPAPTVTNNSVALSWAAPGGDLPALSYRVRWRLRDADADTTGNQPGAWRSTDGDDADCTDASLNYKACGEGASATSYTIASVKTRGTYEVDIGGANADGVSWQTSALRSFAVTVLNDDATLFDLDVVGGHQLTPNFVSATTAYTIAVGNDVTAIKFTPTVTETSGDGATVTIKTGSAQAVAVASGSESAAQTLAVGANTVTLQVTALDGSTTKDYVVTVTRAEASTNSVGALGTLTFSDGTNEIALTKVSPGQGVTPAGFASEHLQYSANVLYAVSQVTITPTLTSASTGASIALGVDAERAAVASGAQSSVTLAVGANAVNIVVTAEDATTTKMYTVTVTRGAASSVALLSALTVNDGAQDLTLTKTGALTTANFDSAHETYDSAQVPHTIGSVTVTATADATSVGASVSGDTGAQSLELGANNLDIVVTAQDASTTKTYSVNVFRKANPALSTDSTITSLRFSRIRHVTQQPDPAFYPAFDPASTHYTVRALNGTAPLSVTDSYTIHSTIAAGATREDEIRGAQWRKNSQSTRVGDEFTMTVPRPVTVFYDITAENMLDKTRYTFAFRSYGRPLRANANLSALSLSAGTLRPVFSAAETSYTTTVANSVASVQVTAAPADAEGFLRVNDVDTASRAQSSAIALTEGAVTLIPIAVYAEDLVTIKTYSLSVTRAANNASSDSSLSDLTVSRGELTPDFDAAVQTYAVAVGNKFSDIKVTPTLTDTTAQVSVAGLRADATHTLQTGVNNIAVLVTAADAVSVTTYTLNVTRAEQFNLNVGAQSGGGDTTADAADGILIARFLLGVTGTDLTAGQSDRAAADVIAELAPGKTLLDLDVDDSGAADYKDGILIARYLLGFSGDALTENLTQQDAATVKQNIDAMRR